MSECQIKRNFCMKHKCWVAKEDDPRCPMSELAADVERLRAEVERLTAQCGCDVIAELQAEVERLKDQRFLAIKERDNWRDEASRSGKEVERLTAALADRDRRIAAAMEVCDQRGPSGRPFLTVWTKEVVRALRGESDE